MTTVRDYATFFSMLVKNDNGDVPVMLDLKAVRSLTAVPLNADMAACEFLQGSTDAIVAIRPDSASVWERNVNRLIAEVDELSGLPESLRVPYRFLHDQLGKSFHVL